MSRRVTFPGGKRIFAAFVAKDGLHGRAMLLSASNIPHCPGQAAVP